MKYIKLTRGKRAIVDDSDFEFLNQWKWFCDKNGYVARDSFSKEKYKLLTYKKRSSANERVYMHRLVNKTPNRLETDHINRNKLDNRKNNLRAVTRSQNEINKGLSSNNTSGYRGVTWNKNIKKWMAQIKLNSKNIYLGCFEDIQCAVSARKQGELLYHSF